jgi:broad specificity phosphatase PhoE
MRLLLIRHGQTPDNVRGDLGTTVPGPGLTALGLRQAEALPEALADERIGALYVSSMVRTQLTAAPLAAARGLEPVVLDDLREVGAGDLEMRHDHEAVTRYMSTVVAWVQGDLDRRMPGGGDGHDFYARFDRGVATALASGHESAAIVSHGAALRGWTGARSTGGGATFVRDHSLDNTGVVVVDGDFESGFRLVSWQGEPVGGPEYDDPSAVDPTGEPAEVDA